MEGHASISSDVVASYAADAALEVHGVRGLVDSLVHRHRGVRVAEGDGATRIELHLALDWGVSAPDVGREVQRRVRDYLRRMTEVEPASVDVVIEEIGAPAGR
jgi:uncharacterized alkaline shock family protein YloU